MATPNATASPVGNRVGLTRNTPTATPAHLDYALSCPPQEVGWHDLDNLARELGPDARKLRWESMIEAAKRDLESGVRAAEAMNTGSLFAWDSATFNAQRAALAKEWGDGATTLALVDILAQALTMQHRWMQIASIRAAAEKTTDEWELRQISKLGTPTLTDAEATEQAMAQADRWNRVCLRTIRALRDLARFAPPVVIQNMPGGQVNVGSQQVNVSQAKP